MSSNLLIKGKGTDVQYINGQWRIDANTGAVIIDDIVLPSGEIAISKDSTIQEVLSDLYQEVLPKIPLIDNATMFKTSDGMDPEFNEVTDLRPGGIYIRFTFKNIDEPLYVSCWLLQSEIERLDALVENGIKKEEFAELYELVNEKATYEQLKLLQKSVESKVDNSQLSIIQSQIDTKANADKVATLESSISNKADKLSVESLKDQLEELSDKINNLSDSEVIEEIGNDINDIIERLDNVSTKDELATVQEQLDEKATKDELKELSDKLGSYEVVNIDEISKQVNNLEKKTTNLGVNVESIDKSIKKKADHTYVEQIDNDLKRKITSLENSIANKASGERLEAVVNDVNATLVTINNTVTDFKNNINSNFSTTKYVNDRDNAILHKINENYTIYKNDVAILQRNISAIEKDITSIEEDVKNIKKSATKEWIQILTPEQYQRIPAARIDPAKLYMCIKFNKPYALYIGSVLIAERNTLQATGFAYSFPLTF